MTLLPLSALGERICVFGPSGSGKSTLAAALSAKLDIPAVHMDQLRFLPNTDYVQRSREEFARLYFEAVAGDRWAFDGNYRSTVQHRLRRATGAIFIDSGRAANFVRYLRRTLFDQHRAGTVEGAPERVKWSMISWILWQEPARRPEHLRWIEASAVPLVVLHSMREVRSAYRAWGLADPHADRPHNLDGATTSR